MPLPQIQFMPQVNQVRELYIQAMKCGNAGELTDFIYFLEECLKEPTWTLSIVSRVQAIALFFPTKIQYKRVLDDTGHMRLYPDTVGLL